MVETERNQTLKKSYSLVLLLLIEGLITASTSRLCASDQDIGIDLTEAGKNKRKAQEKARQKAVQSYQIEQLRIQAAEKQKLQANQLRQRQLAQIKLAKQKRELRARQDKLQRERLQALEREDKRRQEEEKLEAENARQKRLQEEQILSETLRAAEEQRIAKQERRKRLEPLVNKLQFLGTLQDEPLIVFPAELDRLYLVPLGQAHSNFRFQSLNDNSVVVTVENEEFDLAKTGNSSFDIPPEKDQRRYLSDVVRRIKREPSSINYLGTVQFSIDETGVPVDFSSTDDSVAYKAILRAAPFLPPSETFQRARFESTIGFSFEPQTRIRYFLSRIPLKSADRAAK